LLFVVSGGTALPREMTVDRGPSQMVANGGARLRRGQKRPTVVCSFFDDEHPRPAVTGGMRKRQRPDASLSHRYQGRRPIPVAIFIKAAGRFL
jgi:hypothetical protein